MTFGERFQFTLFPVDIDGDSVTVRVEGLPTGATFNEQSGNTWKFEWTVDSIEPVCYMYKVVFTVSSFDIIK